MCVVLITELKVQFACTVISAFLLFCFVLFLYKMQQKTFTAIKKIPIAEILRNTEILFPTYQKGDLETNVYPNKISY